MHPLVLIAPAKVSPEGGYVYYISRQPHLDPPLVPHGGLCQHPEPCPRRLTPTTRLVCHSNGATRTGEYKLFSQVDTIIRLMVALFYIGGSSHD